MKTYKLNTTRPEFLLTMMANGDIDALTTDAMKKSLCQTNHLTYCVYTVLMEADICQEDIVSVNNDGESIAIKFTSKAIAKQVRSLCNKEVVRYGSKKYRMKLKLRDKYLVAEAKLITEDEDEEEAEE